MDTNACLYTNCPMVNNKTQIWEYNLYVSELYPKSDYTVKFKFWDNDKNANIKNECCFTFKIKIVWNRNFTKPKHYNSYNNILLSYKIIFFRLSSQLFIVSHLSPQFTLNLISRILFTYTSPLESSYYSILHSITYFLFFLFTSFLLYTFPLLNLLLLFLTFLKYIQSI